MTSPGDTRNPNVVLSADVSGYQTQIGQADASTRGFIGTIDALTAKLSQLNRTVAQKFTGAAKADALGLTGAIASAATYEKQLSTLSGQAAITQQSMRGTKKAIEDTFTSLPVSRTEVIQLTEALSDMGIKGSRELEKLNTTYEKLAAVTGESPIALAQGLEQLNRIMGGPTATQSAKFANSLLTVSRAAGVSAGSVLDFSQRIAPMARAAGIGEAAVLGISSAFSKAGQDGYVAANAFNSIIYDITRDLQTGSPEIAKYANLIGLTVDQFRRLPGESQITKVLTALGTKGPGAARTLENWGYEGIRTQSAIAGLVQSGNLDKQVALATGSANDTKNLDKGSKAAFAGLADQLVRVRNNFTEVGTVVGTTFLTPITKTVTAVNALATGLRLVLTPLAPLVAGFGAVAGGLSGLVGVAMHASGLIGTAVLGRFLLRSTGMASFSAGRAMARGTEVGDMTPSQQRMITAYNAGSMTRLQQSALNRGIAAETWLQNRVPGEAIGAGQAFRMAALAPLRTIGYLGRDTANFTRVAMQNDLQRGSLTWASRPDGATGPRAAFLNLRESAQAPLGGALYREGRNALGGLWAMTRTNISAGVRMAGAGAAVVAGGLNRALGGEAPSDVFRSTRLAAITLAQAQGVTTKATTGLGEAMMAATRATLRSTMAVGGRVAGSAVGLGVGLAGGALKMAGSALSSPLGMGALIGGTLLYSHEQDRQAQLKAREGEPDYLQPVRLYNDQLGIATTALGGFVKALGEAGAAAVPGLNGVTTASKLSDVVKVSSQDVTTAKTTKSDPKLQALARAGGKKDANALAELAMGYNFTDVTQVQLFKEAAIKAGFPQETVGKALGQLPPLGQATSPTARNSFKDVIKLARNYQGQSSALSQWAGGFGGKNASPTSGELIDMQLAGIGGRAPANAQRYGQSYANQRQLVDTMDMLSELAKGYKGNADTFGSRADIALSNAIAKSIKNAFGLNMGAGKVQDLLSGVDYSSMTSAQRITSIEGLVQAAGGKDQLNALTEGKSDRLNPAKFDEYLAQFAKTGATDPATQKLRASGPLGQYVATPGGAVATAVAAGGNPADNPDAYFAGVKGLVDNSTKFGGSLTGATEQLDRLQASGLATTDVLYQMAAAAKTMIAAAQAYALPQMSRQGQYGAALANFQEARRVATGPHATGEQQASVLPGGAAKNAMEAATEDQRQWEIQTYRMSQQYGRQMERATEDNNYAIRISNRDFHTQELYAQADFYRAQGNAQEDFNRSKLRSTEDFAISMKRQAEQSAQTIYDPFSRVNAKFTIDAGTLIQNLQEQNGRIAQQKRQVDQLRRRGLSQQAVDTLRLDDPNNQQQTSSLVDTLRGTPGAITKINNEVAQRLKGTKNLTQTDTNLNYRNAVEDFDRSATRALQDFQRSSSRASTEFGIQRDRAVAAHSLALADMAVAFNKMTDRTAQDLTDSLTQLTGTFGDLFPKTMDMVVTQLGKYAPQALAILGPMMTKIKLEWDKAVAADTPADTPSATAAEGPRQPNMAAPKVGKGGQNSMNSNTGARPRGGHALGGISLYEHDARISEGNKAETIIPLDRRGQAYMTDMYRAISMSVVQQMQTSMHPMTPTGTSGSVSTSYDYSTEITGPITVVAQDPNKMMEQLAAKQRLARLSRPTRAVGT